MSDKCEYVGEMKFESCDYARVQGEDSWENIQMKRPVPRPFRWLALAPGVRKTLAALGTIVWLGSTLLPVTPTAAAEQGGLIIELNKVEELGGACVASFVFQNKLGAGLDSFNVELILFDKDGVIVRRLVTAIASMPNGKTRVAVLRLHDGPCTGLSRALVNDILSCRAEGNGELDCLAGLSVMSRSAIDLVK